MTIHSTAYISPQVTIDPSWEVGPFCVIKSGVKIGKNLKLSAYCEIREDVSIGDNVSFGSRCTISAGATIGNNVIIKYGFVLTDILNLSESVNQPGVIEDDVMIGANVTMMPKIIIRKGSIIGACSQIRHNTKEYEIWYGNPAKFYRSVK